MILVIDVDYRGDTAVAAGLVFEDWTSDVLKQEITVKLDKVHPYVSGSFYLREMPCLLEVINKVSFDIDLIVLDSFVWLKSTVPGMGKHLFDELKGKIPVVGVAKTHFKDVDCAIEVFRGASKTPLYLTSEGIDNNKAAGYIQSMHGSYRIPTLLKRVDRLCRDTII